MFQGAFNNLAGNTELKVSKFFGQLNCSIPTKTWDKKSLSNGLFDKNINVTSKIY